MQLFVFTFACFILAFAALSLGVIVGRAPLRRGCGSLEGISCQACPRRCPHRSADDRGDAEE